MNESKMMMASIIAQDISQNPATLIAVNRVAEKGEKALQSFIMANAVQALRGEPTAFPNLGMALRAVALENAGLAGLGVVQPTTTTPSTFSIIGDLVGSLATAGTAIYVNREQMKFQEDLLAKQQKIAQAEAEAAAMIAHSQQTTQNVQAAGSGGGIPMAAIAGGVGVLALGGYFLMSKGKRKRR